MRRRITELVFRENYERNGVPWFNADRAQTLASLERVKKRDIGKLPAFPAAAK